MSQFQVLAIILFLGGNICTLLTYFGCTSRSVGRYTVRVQVVDSLGSKMGGCCNLWLGN